MRLGLRHTYRAWNFKVTPTFIENVCIPTVKVLKYVFFFHGTTAPSGPGPPKYSAFPIALNLTPHSAGLLWTRDQPHAETYSHKTNTYVPNGIRTHNSSKLAATDPRLRRRGQRDRYKVRIRILVTGNVKQGYIF
jgi:hypothetical protein